MMLCIHSTVQFAHFPQNLQHTHQNQLPSSTSECLPRNTTLLLTIYTWKKWEKTIIRNYSLEPKAGLSVFSNGAYCVRESRLSKLMKYLVHKKFTRNNKKQWYLLINKHNKLYTKGGENATPKSCNIKEIESHCAGKMAVWTTYFNFSAPFLVKYLPLSSLIWET